MSTSERASPEHARHDDRKNVTHEAREAHNEMRMKRGKYLGIAVHAVAQSDVAVVRGKAKKEPGNAGLSFQLYRCSDYC
ncbi:hypothetical protein ISN76_13910 [Dyella halodurans]|uniref:Uncharacterized protein n=1 Tax=Dyella halodurans TaxID=1920171 RepID=A0ABV9C5I0_9GAMM|nr:hypothetical protein [Dyella halodurans]